MSDQCKHCQVRGDYNKCMSTECFHHENWINKKRIERIKKLKEAVRAALSIQDLWLYNGHVSGEHKGEAQALSLMKKKLESCLED